MTTMKSVSNIQTFFILLLLLLCFLNQLRESHCCHENERVALLNFKSFLTDPDNRLSSWKGQNCCNWYGVGCSPHHSFHVVSLNLNSYQYLDSRLNGTISPALFTLTHLKYLDLSYNNFQFSQIPHQLSNLKNLTHLDLSYSMFSGSITTQFANLSSLRYLDVSSNYALKSSSTNWVKELVKLKILRLSYVDLSMASSSKNWAQPISYLSDLRQIHLSACGISSPVPIREFLNLSQLQELHLPGNINITGQIPVQLANLTSLSVLDLSDCSLNGSIPHLPQIKYLDVSGNRGLFVDATQMFDHRGWPRLQTLDIGRTNVSGSFLASISNATSLINLYASDCLIQGSLPTSISNLSQLKYLYLRWNNISGQIPDSICKISSLQVLYLSGNSLTGTIPSCITKLRNLNRFDVDRNSIGGVVSLISMINELNLTLLDLNSNGITVEIDHHSLPSKYQLGSLDLQSCNLKGNIPAFICNMTHIENLNLSRNSLTGAIPSCLFNLPTLTVLDLSHNKLEGTIPLLLLLPLIYTLDLSSNELEGPLPIPPQNTRFINLSKNKFTGGIPMSFCSEENFSLYVLDLSNNHLSGIIPSSLKYCNFLICLKIGKNNLTGNVPNELAHAKNLQYLELSDNTFNGTFPNCFRRLQYLEFLNLGNNHFEGHIPTFIGSLHNIKILSLRSNKFSGSIPKEINDLHQLQILDLSTNNLSGPIPNKMGNLKMLTSRPNDTLPLAYSLDLELQMVIKGIVAQFEHLYNYDSGIDLSCNILEGDIPYEIGLLKGLAMLNLSHNHLSGKIPTSVGNMISLDSLDLSFNILSGDIPQSLTSIDSLGYIDLASNNLSGEIPRGNHFDTLSVDGLAYNGNTLLCGFPTNKTCEAETSFPKDEYEDEDEDEEDEREKLLFYGVIILGFGVGFWGLFLVLLTRKEKWWFGYWRVVDIVALGIARRILKI